MRQGFDFERGSGGTGSLLLIVGGLLILWALWELLTSAIGSGVQEQRQQDYEMMQAGARSRATPVPVNRGGVKNRNVTF